MTLGCARAAIARRLVAATPPAQLGGITLAPHQRSAAGRLLALLRQHGGALLADDVGLGKTFCALAVAARYQHVLVVHPAALRRMWADAARRAGVTTASVSYEALSRGTAPEGAWELVILDEAHHARSSGARRYRHLATLCARAHTLLLTATPLPNLHRDLHTMLALFLGERAASLDSAALDALVVRRTTAVLENILLPGLAPPRWIELSDDSVTLHRLEALPPPAPAADAGDGGTLLLYSLVRQWASSHAALRAALRRRLARAEAFTAVLGSGRVPTAAELRRWTFADGALQLALPGLDAPGGGGDVEALQAAVIAHRDGLAALLDHLSRSSDADERRVEALLALCRAHRGAKVLAFSEFAETVHGYWRRLRRVPRVARLTASGGEIASGRISREEVLARFAPVGQRRAPPREIERVDLLVTTDLLAEGVDLRDATVVVHLDLPWSPARLQQRVGRARRLGATSASVASYAFRPPAATERLLAVERRLREKGLAAATIGSSAAVLPPDGADTAGHAPSLSSPERRSRMIDRVGTWSAQAPGPVHGAPVRPPRPPTTAADASGDPPLPMIAAGTGEHPGWLAAIELPCGETLVAGGPDGVSDAPAAVEPMIVSVERAMPVGDPDRLTAEVATALGAADAWAFARAAESDIVLRRASPGSVASRALAQASRIHASLPPHRRATLAPLLVRARRTLTGRMPIGLVHELESLLARSTLDGVGWLEAVAALGDGTTTAHAAAPPAIRVLVLLVPG